MMKIERARADRMEEAGRTVRGGATTTIERNPMTDFTPTQGRYLSFIHTYTRRHGRPPAESEIAAAMCVSPPSVNQMVKTLDDLELKQRRMFGYWFDFGDDWFHQVQVERIDQAIPTVTYPRVIRRVGKSPPQYSDAE